MNFQEKCENWLKGSEEERKQAADELILSLANDLRNIAASFGSMHPCGTELLTWKNSPMAAPLS